MLALYRLPGSCVPCCSHGLRGRAREAIPPIELVAHTTVRILGEAVRTLLLECIAMPSCSPAPSGPLYSFLYLCSHKQPSSANTASSYGSGLASRMNGEGNETMSSSSNTPTAPSCNSALRWNAAIQLQRKHAITSGCGGPGTSNTSCPRSLQSKEAWCQGNFKPGRRKITRLES
jgi:hypothetical protein